jgi:hypothetical protein
VEEQAAPTLSEQSLHLQPLNRRTPFRHVEGRSQGSEAFDNIHLHLLLLVDNNNKAVQDDGVACFETWIPERSLGAIQLTKVQ